MATGSALSGARRGPRRPLVLVVYYQTAATVRATIREHLDSFGLYAAAEVHYLNAAFGLPGWVASLPFDVVAFHYTFLAAKWDLAHFRRLLDRCAALRLAPALKVAFPQDEYVHSDAVNAFFREFGVRAVFSVAPPADRERIYAPSAGIVALRETVLTGYVDEGTRARLDPLVRPLAARETAVGYRGRRVPAWLGRRAQVKWRMAEPVRAAAARRGLPADVSCAPEAELRGEEWYRFLLGCRVTLGCEGGASLHDPDGRVRRAVEDYVRDHPDAPFEEVAAACFAGGDDTLDLFVISPRQLDCCVTRTCQVLVEGRYSDVLEPGRHYIPLLPDLSNLDDVLEQVQDVEHCQRIADQAWQDVVASGKYDYRRFVAGWLEAVRGLMPPDATPPEARLSRAALHARDPLTRVALRVRESAFFLLGRPV
jgi:hypothetical protein